MKGRGARTITDADFQAVTPDAEAKTRFVIVDAVGVTEHDYVDAARWTATRSVSLKKLLDKAAALTITEDETATLASRLARLELQLTPAERAELDDGRRRARSRTSSGAWSTRSTPTRRPTPSTRRRSTTASPTPQAPCNAARRRRRTARREPALRQRILELRASHDRVIDEVSVDVLLDAHGVVDTDRARSVVDVVAGLPRRAPRRDHRAAGRLRRTPGPRKVTFADLRELAERIKRPPHNWTPDLIWNAYAAVEADQRPPRRPAHRHRPGLPDPLHPRRGRRAGPYAEHRAGAVRRLARPAGAGRRRRSPNGSAGGSTGSPTSSPQSAGITADDLDNAPFTERGGIDGALRDLGADAGSVPPRTQRGADRMNELPLGWDLASLNDLQADEPRASRRPVRVASHERALYASRVHVSCGCRISVTAGSSTLKLIISQQHFESLRAHEVLAGDLSSPRLAKIHPRVPCPGRTWAGDRQGRLYPRATQYSRWSILRWVMYALQTPAARKWASTGCTASVDHDCGLKTIRAFRCRCRLDRAGAHRRDPRRPSFPPRRRTTPVVAADVAEWRCGRCALMARNAWNWRNNTTLR